MDRKDIEKRVRLWEAEGYDVSELKAKWFSTRRGNGPKRLLIALVVVAILVAVLVSTRPQASFNASPTDGDAPLIVQFYDRSAGIVTSREWDFGDGSTSRIKDPYHTYTREGTYAVRLTVTGMFGSDTRTLSSPIMVAGETSCNLSISSTAGGTVTTPGEGTSAHDAGTVVNLMASSDTGYLFKNWTGNVGTIANVNAASTTITMDGDYSITANFVRTYTLTISSRAGGTVTTPGEGTFTYDSGTVVDLVAEAAEGYRFVRWTGDVETMAEATASPATVFMNDDRVITASFTPIVSPGLPLFSPASGSMGVSITNIGFIWGSLPEAKTYKWVLSKNPDLTSPAETKEGLQTQSYTCTRTLDYSTSYFWQVEAWRDGVMVGKSDIGTFTTEMKPVYPEPPPPRTLAT